MKIDDHGIIRDPSGAKVAVFKDPSLGQRLIDRAGLLSEREAFDLAIDAVNTKGSIQMRRVTMWEIV